MESAPYPLDDQLVEVFVTLAFLLDFGATARRLYLHPSTVTRRIQRLEQSVNGRLFRRTTRTVELTPIGAELLSRLKLERG